MKTRGILLFLLMCLSGASLSATSPTTTLNLSMPSLMMESVLPALSATSLNVSPKQEYKERWFTLRKMHQYFGLASITLATATILAPKPEDDAVDEGPHPVLAQAATATGVLAAASGLVFHAKDLNYGTGFYKDPDNWHALLGSLAVAGFVNAARTEGSGNHGAYGIAGYGAMLMAIKIVW